MNQYSTYCPEDNRLRLYVGRVPRDEYEALRAEGWTSTPKQNCQFVATWSIDRRDRALSYGDGQILDEDQSAEERSVDRAERFSGYRDRRTSDATGQADRYESLPAVHGFQSADRAERAAARHDRIGDRATDAWSKAEYWQQRTAGVISHALYRSGPGVRMGRIKTLEAELRRFEEATHERGVEYANHLRLRLTYENQMLEAQGGRAASIEMVVGGFLMEKQIYRVSKSPVTGRVTSVSVRVPRVTGWVFQVKNVPGTDYALMQIETERLSIDTYRPPTAEDLTKFDQDRKAMKAESKSARGPTIPLLNPSDADAERLQQVWNAHHGARYYGDGTPKTVKRLTQAEYSANSAGTYSPFETVCITGGGTIARTNHSLSVRGCPVVAKIRMHSGRVIIISDKPQKQFPDSVWHDPRPAMVLELEAKFDQLQAIVRHSRCPDDNTPEFDLLEKGWATGLVSCQSTTQLSFTDKGHAWANVQRERLAACV